MDKVALRDLTNTQWAWEFVRRHSHYRFFYERWKHACEGPAELNAEERGRFEQNLEALGPWRDRYAPWVRAGLATGKRFVRERRVDEPQIKGRYVEADLHLDPMQFLLTDWIDPDTTPLPLDCRPFDRAGTLDLGVLHELSDEFRAGFELGLIDVVQTDGGALNELTDEVLPLLSHVVDFLEIEGPSVETNSMTASRLCMHGWPRRPSVVELEAASLPDDIRASVLASAVEDRRLYERLSSPRAVSHSVLSIFSTQGTENLDITFNLQFDLTKPLRDQIKAATDILQRQQDLLASRASKVLAMSGDIEVADFNSTYAEYLDLLDAYDQIEGDTLRGRLANAIRIVAKDRTLGTTESEYSRLEKAWRRADMIRSGGFRSLAFL